MDQIPGLDIVLEAGIRPMHIEGRFAQDPGARQRQSQTKLLWRVGGLASVGLAIRVQLQLHQTDHQQQLLTPNPGPEYLSLRWADRHSLRVHSLPASTDC